MGGFALLVSSFCASISLAVREFGGDIRTSPVDGQFFTLVIWSHHVSTMWYIRKGGKENALERALIFRRLRLSLRDLFFFHFSLMSFKFGVSYGGL
jgi:hypothetical protein